MNKLSWHKILFYILISVSTCLDVNGQPNVLVLQAGLLFNGEVFQEDQTIIIEDGLISHVGPSNLVTIPSNATILDFKDETIMPGMIEGHSHILLHPYDETSWNDQVLKESLSERVLRAGNHLKASLLAGITTMRDLGSEGAGYADVNIKESVEKGIIIGPDLIVAGPAIVTTGSYGPKGFAPHVKVPLGAHEADGYDGLIKEVRRQIGGGADLIKIYADYRWGPYGEAKPTFTEKELALVVEIAKSSGRQVVAHASTAEGMRRATLAGVSTIEHGDGGTREVFELMKKHNVALCPTLAAGDAIMQYRGWQKDKEGEPERIKQKRLSFAIALEVGVSIVAGGDVGVFPHGENVREFEMMVEYGMSVLDVLKSITSTNATLLNLKGKGKLEKGYVADLICLYDDPRKDISILREVSTVIKNGKIIKD